MENVVEFGYLTDVSILADSFLKWLKLEAKLENELFEQGTDAHWLVDDFQVFEHGDRHLNQTIRAEATGKRLVQVLKAQEFLQKKCKYSQTGILINTLPDILAALESQMFVLGLIHVVKHWLPGLDQSDIDIEYSNLFI